MALINGNPAISYGDAIKGDLKYSRSTDPNGEAWASPVTIESTGNVGGYSSLASFLDTFSTQHLTGALHAFEGDRSALSRLGWPHSVVAQPLRVPVVAHDF